LFAQKSRKKKERTVISTLDSLRSVPGNHIFAFALSQTSSVNPQSQFRRDAVVGSGRTQDLLLLDVTPLSLGIAAVPPVVDHNATSSLSSSTSTTSTTTVSTSTSSTTTTNLARLPTAASLQADEQSNRLTMSTIVTQIRISRLSFVYGFRCSYLLVSSSFYACACPKDCAQYDDSDAQIAIVRRSH
jgi:hypothetical protein